MLLPCPIRGASSPLKMERNQVCRCICSPLIDWTSVSAHLPSVSSGWKYHFSSFQIILPTITISLIHRELLNRFNNWHEKPIPKIPKIACFHICFTSCTSWTACTQLFVLTHFPSIDSKWYIFRADDTVPRMLLPNSTFEFWVSAGRTLTRFFVAASEKCCCCCRVGRRNGTEHWTFQLFL